MTMAVNLDPTGVPDGLFQPNIVLPSQRFSARHQHSPEQRLMIAVLQDAISCVEQYRGVKWSPRVHRDFDEVRRWLLVEDTSWPFSFACICEALDLDASAVRRHLGVMPARLPLRV
jgi:hypothetical protein